MVKQLSFLRKRYSHVFAAGLSAGALLALKASSHVRLDGIGAFSPTFFYDGWNVPRTTILLDLAIRWFPRPLHYVFFHFDGFPYGIKHPALQARLQAAYNPIDSAPEPVSKKNFSTPLFFSRCRLSGFFLEDAGGSGSPLCCREGGSGESHRADVGFAGFRGRFHQCEKFRICP